MVAVYRKDWDSNIDVWIFVVDMVERSTTHQPQVPHREDCSNFYPVNTSLLSLSISSSQGFSP